MANPNPNPIIAAVIDDLEGTIIDVDVVQRHLDSVRAQTAANNAIYADSAAQLAQARRCLAEALFAAAHRAPPEPEGHLKTQLPAVLPESESEPEPEPDEEDLEAAVAVLAADLAEVAPRVVEALQEEEGQGQVVVMLTLGVADPEVEARAADYLRIAVHMEFILQDGRILVQANVFLLLVRAAAFAVTRAHLLPGVLLTAAAAYALVYAASGGTVVPGFASLMRISALMLCFLFGVPVVGNLA